MKYVKIPSGKHKRFSVPKLTTSKRHRRVVTFTPSCRYDIKEDQLDWNKLFGVGFFPHHHKTSYRFGWRYNLDKGKIEISVYYYIKGEKFSEKVFEVRVNHPYIFEIERSEDEIVWRINTLEVWRVKGPWQKIGYQLNEYFGGNRTAPHDIYMQIKKLKNQRKC
jgi:hypothetical protein